MRDLGNSSNDDDRRDHASTHLRMGDTIGRTGTDPRRNSWAVSDEIVRLRLRGTTTYYKMPRTLPTARAPARKSTRREASPGYTIGSTKNSDICLLDPSQRVSRRHALLMRSNEGWALLDVGSKNGLRVDGVHQYAAQLEPGMEIEIGGLTLIAESPKYIDLRGFICRLLGWGWGNDVDRTVDRAMRDLRWAPRRRNPIALSGEGDMVPLARELHYRLTGPASPFVVCDPKRRSRGQDIRSPENHENWQAALVAAQRGTLCVRSERLPEDFGALSEAVRTTPDPVLLLICDDGISGQPIGSIDSINVPPLGSRGREQLEHIVLEYFLEAGRQYSVEGLPKPEDRVWVLDHAATSIAEISAATKRLTALRSAGSLAGAAELLGMAPVSLRRWLHRRAAPPALNAKDGDEMSTEECE